MPIEPVVVEHIPRDAVQVASFTRDGLIYVHSTNIYRAHYNSYTVYECKTVSGLQDTLRDLLNTLED